MALLRTWAGEGRKESPLDFSASKELLHWDCNEMNEKNRKEDADSLLFN